MASSASLMDASVALSELPDRATYLDAARQTIATLLPADDVFWMESDFATKTASVCHGPTGAYDEALSEAMGQTTAFSPFASTSRTSTPNSAAATVSRPSTTLAASAYLPGQPPRSTP
jgi:hypothetical protein